MKFYGTLPELQAIIARTCVPGSWSGTNPHEFIVADKSAKLRWWPSTGTIFVDGKQHARDAFATIVADVIPNVGLPSTLSTTSASK